MHALRALSCLAHLCWCECAPWINALYVFLKCMPWCMFYMSALHVCLICLPYMSALYVCHVCLPYMSALYVCLICLPYMSALHISRQASRIAADTRARTDTKTRLQKRASMRGTHTRLKNIHAYNTRLQVQVHVYGGAQVCAVHIHV